VFSLPNILEYNDNIYIQLNTKLFFVPLVATSFWSCFNYQLNAQFLYSITVCVLHYNTRHGSSINMPIFRRTNCIITASGIATLYKRLYGMPVESRLQKSALDSALNRHTVQPFTESDDTRCCDSTICPPEDGHVNARNMSRIVM